MARIALDGDRLIVQVEGMDQLWALKSRLELPLAHVRDAHPDRDEAHRFWHGLRLPGTHLPGVITAGTFYQQGQWVFWDVHDADRSVAVLLADERYAKLVVQVDDPEATAAMIRSAIAARAISGADPG